MLASSSSVAARLLLCIFFAILVFVGLVGNCMICLAVYKTRSLRKKRYLYFVSLACADLILCLFVMPPAAVHDSLGRWVFGGTYCRAWFTLDIACCTSSILHLCAISVDRFMFIHDPLHYRAKTTLASVCGILAAIWIASFGVAASVLWMPTGSQPSAVTLETRSGNVSTVDEVDSGIRSAVDDTTSRTPTILDTFDLHSNRTSLGAFEFDSTEQCGFSLDPIYALILSSVSFYIPCAIMLITYRKLYIYARYHSRVIGHQLRAAAEFLLVVAMQKPKSAKPIESTAEPKQRRRTGRRFRLSAILRRFSKNRKRERVKHGSVQKARITLGVTMGMFIISWLPYFVCTVVRAFRADLIPQWLFVGLTWMGYANSAQNPIIYSIFNKDFRFAFAKMLSRRSRRPSPAELVSFRYSQLYQNPEITLVL